MKLVMQERTTTFEVVRTWRRASARTEIWPQGITWASDIRSRSRQLKFMFLWTFESPIREKTWLTDILSVSNQPCDWKIFSYSHTSKRDGYNVDQLELTKRKIENQMEPVDWSSNGGATNQIDWFILDFDVRDVGSNPRKTKRIPYPFYLVIEECLNGIDLFPHIYKCISSKYALKNLYD